MTARSGIISVVTTTSAHFGPSSMLIALEITAREAGTDDGAPGFR